MFLKLLGLLQDKNEAECTLQLETNIQKRKKIPVSHKILGLKSKKAKK
jgi:hypothetical protein